MENIEANMTLQTQFNAPQKKKKVAEILCFAGLVAIAKAPAWPAPLSFRSASRSHFCFQPLIQESI